jgi:hypothetical protein
MFPQPWYPTKCFPHPLSNRGFESNWSLKNRLSFRIVDEFMWLGLGSIINDFRRNVISLNPSLFSSYSPLSRFTCFLFDLVKAVNLYFKILMSQSRTCGHHHLFLVVLIGHLMLMLLVTSLVLVV